MQIVIELSELDYRWITLRKGDETLYPLTLTVYEAIKNGKPLKTGHWTHGGYCSECGCDVPAYIIDWKWQKDMDAKYCPICGANMQESED